MSQMKRVIRIGVGQLGPVSRKESKASVVKRLVALMQQAKSGGCDVIVYPEMALTTFFPRWVLNDPSEADAYCESELPNADTAPSMLGRSATNAKATIAAVSKSSTASTQRRFVS